MATLDSTSPWHATIHVCGISLTPAHSTTSHVAEMNLPSPWHKSVCGCGQLQAHQTILKLLMVEQTITHLALLIALPKASVTVLILGKGLDIVKSTRKDA